MGEQLKLLFITQDFHTNVDRLTYYLEEGLAKVCQFTVWHHDGHIQEILTKLPFQPDFILLNDVKPEYMPDIVGRPELSIPLGAFMFDLHWRSDYRKRFILENRVQHVFTHYRDKFYEWYPELTDRMHWFPLWANTEVFRDYSLTKDIDYGKGIAVGTDATHGGLASFATRCRDQVDSEAVRRERSRLIGDFES